MAVGSKCRPIRLLSGAVPLYAPTVKLPRQTRVCPDHLWSDILSPQHLLRPRKQLWQTLLSGLCYRRYGGQMSAMVIFGGHVSEKGANAQQALRINAVTILIV